MRLPGLKAYKIKLLFEQGKTIKGRYMILKYQWQEEKRVGVGASRRVRTKPKRNRIKRRIRELIRLHWDEMPKIYGFFIGKPEVLEAKWKDLEEDFLKIIEKLKER